MPSNRLKKAGKAVITVLLLVILAVNLLTVIFSALGLRQPLGWMPVALLAVNSGSMEPVFSPGDALLVAEVPYDRLEIGDIVTFHHGDELVTHQIVGEENNRFITKGTANNYEDDPIGPEEYCAKEVLALPGVGWLLSYLSKPAELALISAFLFVLLFGRPILAYIYEKSGKKRARPDESPAPRAARAGIGRILALLAAVSVVAVMPFITAAKYTARINVYTAVSASSLNFSSNYLSEAGSVYCVKGWNGQDYSINLRIKDYGNDLLMNMDGQDLYYGLCVVPVASDGPDTYKTYGADYTVSLTPDGSVTAAPPDAPYSFPAEWPEADRYGPYLLAGSDGMKLEHNFTVQVQAAGAGLAPNDKVRFKIFACTSGQDQFFMELMGDFTFEVRESAQFIRETHLGQSADATLVTFLLKTNLIDDGASTKNVLFTWDTSKLYLNEFESAAYNIITNQPGNYDKANGTLIMPMQAYSSVTLQFFKIGAGETIEDTDITAAVIPDS